MSTNYWHCDSASMKWWHENQQVMLWIIKKQIIYKCFYEGNGFQEILWGRPLLWRSHCLPARWSYFLDFLGLLQQKDLCVLICSILRALPPAFLHYHFLYAFFAQRLGIKNRFRLYHNKSSKTSLAHYRPAKEHLSVKWFIRGGRCSREAILNFLLFSFMCNLTLTLW